MEPRHLAGVRLGKTAPDPTCETQNALPGKVTWEFSQVPFGRRAQVWKRFSNRPPPFAHL